MNAIDTLSNIADTHLIDANLKYCLVDSNKKPVRFDGEPARPNRVDDFVDISMLFQNTDLSLYSGVGISIQASNVCAIDVDHCFSEPFNIYSADQRAKDILYMFHEFAYCEFSFSGTGLRILFLADLIENYSDKYYIKNEKNSIEFYQPSKSFRYVTITGRSIYDNDIVWLNNSILEDFLDTFMTRPDKVIYTIKTTSDESRDINQLYEVVRYLFFKDNQFQELWFNHAPGSGADESERDYHLVAYLYENVTQDKDKLKQLFEMSPFFKSKDSKHIFKWTNQDGRYFNYLYNRISRRTR